jgi:hypothetical protein
MESRALARSLGQPAICSLVSAFPQPREQAPGEIEGTRLLWNVDGLLGGDAVDAQPSQNATKG